MANKMKKSKGSKFVLVYLWTDTKNRLAEVAKNRGESLAQYVDNLSKVELK